MAAKGLIFFQDFVEQPNVYTNQVDSSDGSASHLLIRDAAVVIVAYYRSWPRLCLTMLDLKHL